jgi:hypothetical protein
MLELLKKSTFLSVLRHSFSVPSLSDFYSICQSVSGFPAVWIEHFLCCFIVIYRKSSFSEMANKSLQEPIMSSDRLSFHCLFCINKSWVLMLKVWLICVFCHKDKHGTARSLSVLLGDAELVIRHALLCFITLRHRRSPNLGQSEPCQNRAGRIYCTGSARG